MSTITKKVPLSNTLRDILQSLILTHQDMDLILIFGDLSLVLFFADYQLLYFSLHSLVFFLELSHSYPECLEFVGVSVLSLA